MQWMTPDIAEACARHFSFSGFDARGRCVGCAGIAPEEGGELVAWAVFSPLLFANRLAVTRAVKAGLELHRGRRITAYIQENHGKAARFAEALDFHHRQTRADIHPSGATVLVYVRDA